MCVCMWMEWTWSMQYVGISTSVHSVPWQYYTQASTCTCIHKPFEDSKPTGLKVVTATFTCLSVCVENVLPWNSMFIWWRAWGWREGVICVHCERHVNGSGDSFLTKYSASGQHVLLTFFQTPVPVLNLTLMLLFFFGQACSYLSFHRAGTEF